MNALRAGRWTTTLVWLHDALFAAIAVLGYASPETLFGGAAWLPLARLAVLLFAATLASAAILLAGAAFWASARHVGVALIAVLAFDVQVPVLMFAQAASLEYLERELGGMVDRAAWVLVADCGDGLCRRDDAPRRKTAFVRLAMPSQVAWPRWAAQSWPYGPTGPR